MKNIKSFNSFTDNQSQNYLAQSFPKGKLFSNIFDSGRNIYKYVLSLAVWVKIVTGQLFTLAKNRDITKLDELLTEYETSVKLPEKFAILDTLTKRRLAVNRLISKIPVINIGDINDITNMDYYIKAMTDIDTTLELNTDGSTSSFVIPFPIVFGIPYFNRRLIIKVKYAAGIDSDTTREKLNNALEYIVPTFQTWDFELI